MLLAVGESYHDLAIQLQDKNYNQKAVKSLQCGLAIIGRSEIRPSQIASAVVTLSFALLNLGRTEEAIDLLDFWINDVRDCAELNIARGIVRLTIDYKSSTPDFELAVQLNTKSVLP